jgi:hypothetical protein
MSKIVAQHRAVEGPRTLRAVKEQWAASEDLYKHPHPLKIKEMADEQELMYAHKKDDAEKTGIMMLFRAARRKQKLIDARRAQILAQRSDEAAKLAAAVAEKAAAAEATRRERAIAMGINPNLDKKRTGSSRSS